MFSIICLRRLKRVTTFWRDSQSSTKFQSKPYAVAGECFRFVVSLLILLASSSPSSLITSWFIYVIQKFMLIALAFGVCCLLLANQTTGADVSLGCPSGPFCLTSFSPLEPFKPIISPPKNGAVCLGCPGCPRCDWYEGRVD